MKMKRSVAKSLATQVATAALLIAVGGTVPASAALVVDDFNWGGGDYMFATGSLGAPTFPRVTTRDSAAGTPLGGKRNNSLVVFDSATATPLTTPTATTDQQGTDVRNDVFLNGSPTPNGLFINTGNNSGYIFQTTWDGSANNGSGAAPKTLTSAGGTGKVHDAVTDGLTPVDFTQNGHADTLMLDVIDLQPDDANAHFIVRVWDDDGITTKEATNTISFETIGSTVGAGWDGTLKFKYDDFVGDAVDFSQITAIQLEVRASIKTDDSGYGTEILPFVGEVPIDKGAVDVTITNFRTNEIPEPATVLLMGVGLMGAGYASRRRKNR